MKSLLTEMRMQIAPKYFLYLPTELFRIGLWSKQLSHLSSVSSMMCQDPEIAFVLIMLMFKRKQFAFDLQSEQFFTIFLVLSNSLYFPVTDADVIACFLLRA